MYSRFHIITERIKVVVEEAAHSFIVCRDTGLTSQQCVTWQCR